MDVLNFVKYSLFRGLPASKGCANILTAVWRLRTIGRRGGNGEAYSFNIQIDMTFYMKSERFLAPSCRALVDNKAPEIPDIL